VYEGIADFCDLIHRARGRNAALEAALVGQEVRRRNPTSRSMLDVACGSGQHLAVLAQDFEVTGIDLSESMLASAAAKAPHVSLQTADMRTFDLGRRFDAVVSIDSGIGYLADQKELNAAVAAMAAHLEPGGVLMVEGWYEPEFWLSSVSVDARTEESTAVARFTRSTRDGQRTELNIRYEILTAAGHQTIEELHVLQLSLPDEVRSAFEMAGLAFERLPHMLRPGRSVYVGMWK